MFLLLTEDECNQARPHGVDLGKPKHAIGKYRIFVYDSARELYDAVGVPWREGKKTVAPSGVGG